MSQMEVRPGAELTPIQAAERKLWRSVGKGLVIAIPICVVIWVGIALLALDAADWQGSWASEIAIGAVIGIVAGCFFGGWAGALAAAHDLDAADRADAVGAHRH
jgi:hypothetical protein